jgi:hypothetical protein
MASLTDDETAAVLEQCVAFWGDVYVRAAYALGVTQHVADDQRVRRSGASQAFGGKRTARCVCVCVCVCVHTVPSAESAPAGVCALQSSQRFLESREERQRAAAASTAPAAAAAPPAVAAPATTLAQAERPRAKPAAPPPSSGELSVDSILAQARLLRAEMARRGGDAKKSVAAAAEKAPVATSAAVRAAAPAAPRPGAGRGRGAATVSSSGSSRAAAALERPAAAPAPAAAPLVAAAAALSVADAAAAPPPPARPLALPEQLHAAAASLGALGVYPGTTLRQLASECAAPSPPPAAQLAFSARLHAALPAQLDAHAPPPTVAPRVALRAAADALRWELDALASVDCRAALREDAPPEAVSDAARTLEHVFRCGIARVMRAARSKSAHGKRVCALLCTDGCTTNSASLLAACRLHADVCAQLAALERSQARAQRWRDGLLRALAPGGGGAAGDGPLSPPPPPPLPPHVGPPEAWLPPCAWALLPCGSPAQLWPPDDVTTLTYTVRPPRATPTPALRDAFSRVCARSFALLGCIDITGVCVCVPAVCGGAGRAVVAAAAAAVRCAACAL